MRSETSITYSICAVPLSKGLRVQAANWLLDAMLSSPLRSKNAGISLLQDEMGCGTPHANYRHPDFSSTPVIPII